MIMIYGKIERGVKVRPDASVPHYTYICGATSQKALHTDAASRPYTDQSRILHENTMEQELSP